MLNEKALSLKADRSSLSSMNNYTDLSLLEQLVDAQSLQQLSAIKAELLHNFEVGQLFRSRWEMENSVLNDIKFPTPDAKYWQSVREQQVHFGELVMLAFEHRKTKARIKLLLAKQAKLYLPPSQRGLGDLTDAEQAARAELLQIEIERLQYILLHQARTAKDRIREILSWHDIMQRLRLLMKHGIDSYEEHQAESYYLRFQRERQIAQQSMASPSEARNLMALAEMATKQFAKVK